MPTGKASPSTTDKRYRSYDEFEKDVFPRVYRERVGKREESARDTRGRDVAAEILKGVRKHLSS